MTTIIDENGNPWWVAKEVCDILELTNVSKAVKYLDDDEKMKLTISKFQDRGHGGDSGNRVVISEPGLYELIFRSRKPEAKTFKRWIKHIVVPEIRRTGGFLHTTWDITAN